MEERSIYTFKAEDNKEQGKGTELKQRAGVETNDDQGTDLKQPAEVETNDIKIDDGDRLSTLFHKLRIHKYLAAFKTEEYEYEDLAEISVEEMEELIPKKGPRNRLKRWLASQKTGFAKPVLMSLKSKSNAKQLFSDKFLSSLSSLSNVNKETKSSLALLEDQKTYILKLMAKSEGGTIEKYDAFLSHAQKDSADLCRSVYLALGNKNVKVWYDKEAHRLDNRGMIEGIFGSSEFVMVLVRDYFKRVYCVFEYLVAMAFKKPVTVLLENDDRFGGLTIKEIPKEVPKLYLEYIMSHEIIAVNREYFGGFIEKVEKRLKRHQKEVRDHPAVEDHN